MNLKLLKKSWGGGGGGAQNAGNQQKEESKIVFFGTELSLLISDAITSLVTLHLVNNTKFDELENKSFEKKNSVKGILFCLGFLAISTIFQLFNSNSSQIHVPWTILNQSTILTLAGQS